MTIHEALRLIAGKDLDGARVINGVGFSMHDTIFGNSLADRATLTPKMEWHAARLVRKYRKQVAQLTGVCEGLKGKAATDKLDEFLTALVWEHQGESEKPKNVGTVSALVGKDTGAVKAFVIRFPYNAHLVAAVKALPSRHYDATGKKWVVEAPNAADVTAIRNLVAAEGLTLTEGAAKILAAWKE